jgi:hypothetical protein
MPGPLDGLTVGLFINDATPTPQSVIGDFELADFPGYAAVALDDLAGPKALPGDRWGYDQFAQFAANDAVEPTQTAYGYIIYEAGAPNVYRGGERFAQPYNFAGIGNFIALLIVLALSSYWPSGLVNFEEAPE